jgi:GntR family transcriptional repressor for pyruvate dehydrogenase complex
LDVLQRVNASTSLADRVAGLLTEEILSGRWPVGSKLPTEVRLVEQLGVSRTVIREAISRLRNAGLVEPRQGSGVFVLKPATAPLDLAVDEAQTPETKIKVLQIVEVRRAVEGEAAGLAAERAAPADVEAMRAALVTLDEAVAGGGDGVDEDLAFHRVIADASGNPVMAATVRYLGDVLRTGIQVTRANEARRDDFIEQVRTEHGAIVDAIEAGDRKAARDAARRHMRHAARRLQDADEGFWAETTVDVETPDVETP